jgi:hypothetical protein
MVSDANTDVDKLIDFGQMALEQGWYDQAREYFKQALELDVSNREAMKGLARVNEILSRKTAVAFKPIQDKPVKPRPKVATTNTVAYGLAAILVLAVVATLVWIAYSMFIEPRREAAVAPTATAIRAETPKTKPAMATPIPSASVKAAPTLEPVEASPTPKPKLSTATPIPPTPTPKPQPPTATPIPPTATRVLPTPDCHPQRRITYPPIGAVLSGIVEIRGSADTEHFDYYLLEFRQKGKSEWTRFQRSDEPVVDDILGIWDASSLPTGVYRLRLIVVFAGGGYWGPCEVDVTIEH